MKRALRLVSILLALALLSMSLLGCAQKPPTSSSQQPKGVVKLLTWGGTVQQTFEDQGWGQKFQQETGYQVVVVPKDTSAEICAEAIAEKNNPQVDVVMCDEGPLLVADQQGVFAPLDPSKITNMADLMPAARPQGNSDILRAYADCAALIYSPAYFQQHNLQPPDSWGDLLKPEFKGKIMANSIDNTFGLYTLVELAQLNGGGINNIDPGFQALKTLASNVFDWSDTIAKFDQGFQSGQIAMVQDEWVDAVSMKDAGIPIAFVLPKEGGFGSPCSAAIMKNAPNPGGAAALLNFMESAEFGAFNGNTYGKGSYNTKAQYDPSKASDILTPDKIAKLRDFDWTTVTPLRAAWTERYDEIIGAKSSS
jgi:putative spermidine/putrescine transport system substrate-binding protein